MQLFLQKLGFDNVLDKKRIPKKQFLTNIADNMTDTYIDNFYSLFKINVNHTNIHD